MKSIYFEKDDIFEIRVSDKPIVREVSQGWHTNISYAADGTIVEIILLDAKKEGLLNSTLPSTFSVIGDPRLNEINGLRGFLC